MASCGSIDGMNASRVGRFGALRALWNASLLCAACVTSASAQTAPPMAAGFELAATLKHAAYDLAGAPSVIVHAPAGFDATAPLQLVVFLHGYRGCLSVLMGKGPSRCQPGAAQVEGWDLGRYHDAAHTNTLFVVPQLAYMKRDGRPGRFAQAGGFRRFLEELLRGPLAEKLGVARSLQDVARIDLVAHSAGYQALIAILERGGVEPPQVRSVTLLDALYGETERYARYVEQHARELKLVDLSLPNGAPAHESTRLARRLMRTLGADRVTSVDPDGIGDAISRYPVVFAHGRPPHRLMPASHLTQVLKALHGTHGP
jgi:hypothetical protein